MRWVVAAVGALVLAAGIYLGLRPRWTRPVLRVGIDFKAGSVESEALAAGVALAFNDRDERAGPFRVTAVRADPLASKRHFRIPLPGLQSVPERWLDESGAMVIAPDVNEQAEGIWAWAKARDVRRVAFPSSWRPPPEDKSTGSYVALGMRQNLAQVFHQRPPAFDLFWPEESRDLRPTLDARPDLIVLENSPDKAVDLRASGFNGPIFLSAFSLKASDPGLDGCLAVLQPLKPAPPDFRRRHPHPFAWAGYRGALRFLDALDGNPEGPPEELCFPSIFDDLVDAPRVYELRGGRFIPK